MPTANLQEKMPAVWSEKGSQTNFSDLSEGHLIKVSLHSPNCGNSSRTTFLGIYRGIKESDCGPQLVLETEGERLIANTAGHMCESLLEKFYLDNVQLIEILARDFHAVSAIFHTLGVSEVYRKNSENRIKQAQVCLKDLSGLNLIGI